MIKGGRILILAQGIDGGIAPLVSSLAYGLKKNGSALAVRYVGRPAQSRFVEIDISRGIDSGVICTGDARSLSEVIGLLRSVLDAVRLVRNIKPDAIIFAGFMPALVYPLFLRPICNSSFTFWDHAPQNTYLKIKQCLFLLPLKLMNSIVSISQSTASALSAYFGVDKAKIVLIPNGVEPDRWLRVPPVKDYKTLRILMPARLDLNQKDQLTLIRAAALLHRNAVPVEVTLVGSGSDREIIENEIKKESANSYVHIIDHSDDVPSLLSGHNVVCLSTRFEGLPTVVIEAFLAQRIVVASRVAGCIDLIRDGENGLLSEPGSASDLAEKLEAVYAGNIPTTLISTAHQEALERYTPKSMIDAFVKVLDASTSV